MKFSIIYEAQMVDTSRENEAQVFADMIEQCVLAEEMGFDVIWSVEHHCLTQYAHLSAPESFLAFVAGRTKRIHVGHGVVCLPFKMNHPIKVAERVATLDILSRGRLHFGVGKGGTQQEAGTFGYELADLQPMIDESMYLILHLLLLLVDSNALESLQNLLIMRKDGGLGNGTETSHLSKSSDR